MLISSFNRLKPSLVIGLVLISGVFGSGSIDCDFDNDTCGWIDTDQVWTVGSSASDHHNLTWTPVQGDHLNGPGGYLYLDPVKLSPTSRRLGTLTSPQITESNVCLSFWYYMFGLEPGELTIKQSLDGSEKPVWLRQSNNGRQWTKASVELTDDSKTPWTIEFSAGYSAIHHEILAIDDIRISPGQCPLEVCDFETTFCGSRIQSSGTSSWSLGTPGDLKHPLIVNDHSTQTDVGHFVYVRGVDAKDVATILTETFDHAGLRCLKFWYTSTSDSAEMKVYQVNQRSYSGQELWMRNRNHFGDWRQGVVQLQEMTSSLYNIDFRVSFDAADGGYYLLDDISIEVGLCSRPVDCDFTYDTCQWVTTNTMATSDWIRMSGQLLGSGLTGPGNGQDDKDDDDFYLYTYFDPALPIDSAIIDSGDFDVAKSDSYCLQFDLFTVNPIKLQLIVEMLLDADELEPVLILKSNDLPDSEWRGISAIINVTSSRSVNDFQFLRLRASYVSEDEELGPDGKPKPHPFAAIAVDDITFTEGLCNQKPTTNPPPTVPSVVYEINCDFETDLCGLFNDPLKSTSPWYRRTAVHSKSDIKNVPSVDHTYNQPSGHFLFSRIQTKGDKKVSELSTQTIKAIDSIDGACLSFWYYIRGTKATSLSISMVRAFDSAETLIWKRSNVFADYWYKGYVNIPSVTYDFNLKMVADHATDSDSGMALDDILYSIKPCSASYDDRGCDFELGSCGFDNGNVFNEIWQLTNGSAISSIGVDYTTQTGSGSFMIARNDSSIDFGEDAKSGYLIYDKFISGEFNCIQFAANVHDGQLSFISVMAGYQGELDSQTQWSIDETDEWTLVRIPLPFPGDAKLISYRFEGQGYAALDDISLLTECQPMGYCNFEKDNCGWTKDNAGNSGFRRDHGRLSDEFSPPYDVTTKKDSGSYAVVSFESVKKPGNEKYSLTSPLISPMAPSNYCLSFWYYENGKELPTLHAILNQIDAKGNKKLTYLESIVPSSVVDFWNRKSIQITQVPGLPFTIEFRASVKAATKRPSLVAIDDIELYPGQCADSIEVIDETVYYCDSQATNLTGNLLCDFHADCKDAWDESSCGYDCDFEVGSCGWKGGAKPDTPLNIIDLDKSSTSPKYEITLNETGKGKYWKLNTKTSTTLTYLSPVMRNSDEHCYINFYLYMNINAEKEAELTSDISKLPHLSISIVDLRSTQVTLIHQFVNDLGKEWHPIRLYIGRIPSDFQLRLEVRTKKGSDLIAIDKITADPNCAVPRVGDDESCPSNQFFCSRSKRCIDPELTCDYRDDCGDGEDEDDDLAQCSLRSGRCDFNQGDFCDWSSEPTTLRNEKWNLIDYDDTFDVRSTIPTRDHTFNTAEGKFALNNGTTGLPVYSLSSPSLFRPEPESICSFNFYYQFTDARSVIKAVNSSAIGQSNHNYLEVQIVLPHLTNSRNSLETILGSYLLESPHFKRATISIGPEVVTHNRLFQLSLSAVRAADSASSWAVDDLSFSSDCTLADCYLRCGQDQSCISLDRRCDFIPDCDSNDENVSPDEAKCTSVSCPFDKDDTCHWEVIKTNDTNNLTWKLYQPLSDPVDQPQFIPKLDATKQDASAWLMLFDSRDSSTSGSVELWSQMIGRSSAQCSLSFNYWCQLDQCDLTIYLETDIDRPGTNLKRLWEPHQLSTIHDLTPKWRNGIALIGAIRYGRIMFKASSDSNDQQFAIGLDDLTFVNCAPPQPSPLETPCDSMTSFQCSNDNCIDKTFECDFVDDCLDGSDESFCNNLPARCDFETPCTSWESDSYRFDRFSSVSWAQTPDLPSYDHTLGVSSGTYLSLSGSQKPVDLRARHYSQIISGSTSKSADCALNLWVNIIDYLLTSELVIYQRFNYSSSGYKVIARVSPNYLGEYWKKYHIQLPETDNDYQIVLEGFIAANNDASINIDDITLTQGCNLAENGTVLSGEPDEPTVAPLLTTPLFECYYGYKPCSSVTRCYPLEAECDFKDDCGDGTDEATCQSHCTFENDWCGWTNDQSKFGLWIRQKANNTKRLIKDHTEGDETGTYGLATFEQKPVASVSALLTSPLYNSCGPRCTFTFYYHMTLETVTDKQPRLQVYLNQGNSSKLISSIGGKHTDEWYTSYVNIGQSDEPFSVTIEAIKLDESTDLIKAIDDLAFDDCASSKKKIIEDCPVNQWECQSKCIPVAHLCDGFNDCSDGQDESNCPVVNGNCDFSPTWRGQCAWMLSDITESDVGEVCTIINPTSKIDYIEIDPNDYWTCDSTLVSPKFPPMVNDFCHFTFQYKIETRSDETLFKINLISNDEVTSLYKFKANRVPTDWTVHHVAINHSAPYQVSIITSIDDESKIFFRSFRFSANCQTGQPLTLDLYPGKTEPWEPTSSQPRPVTTVRPPTDAPVTIPPPVTRPEPVTAPKPKPRPTPSVITTIPEHVTQKPEIKCDCDGNSIPDECRVICNNQVSPQVNPKKHSSASILYLSFGLIASIVVILIVINFAMPVINRYRYRRTIRGILDDDRFNDDGQFDVVDGRHSISTQNLFGLTETRTRFRNQEDSL